MSDVDLQEQEPATTSAASRKRRAVLKRRNLPLLMLVARETVTSYFRPTFNEFGMTEQQWRIIRLLYEQGELMISQVADRTFIMAPSLSGILRRMIEADLIVKRLDPKDTRRFFVSLTKLGRSKFEAMVPRVQAAYKELEQHIGLADIEEIYELMDRVLASIHRARRE